MHWEEKERAERRTSLKDTQHKIRSGIYKKMGDKKTWQFGSVTPASPEDDVRQYPRPNEGIQLTSTALVGEPKGKLESSFWPRKGQTACDCSMDNPPRGLYSGVRGGICVL